MSRIELWIIFRKYLVAKAPCVVEFSQGEKEKRIVSGVLLIGVAKQYLILLLSFPPSAKLQKKTRFLLSGNAGLLGSN